MSCPLEEFRRMPGPDSTEEGISSEEGTQVRGMARGYIKRHRGTGGFLGASSGAVSWRGVEMRQQKAGRAQDEQARWG